MHIFMNLICILIPCLLFQQVTEYYQHDVELPTQGGGSSAAAAPTNQPFNLKLTINSDGSFMIVNAKTLSTADGLAQGGAGMVVTPLGDGTPDYATLQRVLSKEKTQRLGGQPPEAYPDPDQITVSAPQDLDYQKIISTLDHLRYQPYTPGADLSDSEAHPDMFTVISLSPGSIGG